MFSATCPQTAPTFAIHCSNPRTVDDNALDRLCDDPLLSTPPVSRKVIRTTVITAACSFTITLAFLLW